MLKAERQPGEPADAEHRQERQREQHRRVEADRRRPTATVISAVRITTDGIEMIIVVVWKNVAIVVPMPVMNMWCAQTMNDMKPRKTSE